MSFCNHGFVYFVYAKIYQLNSKGYLANKMLRVWPAEESIAAAWGHVFLSVACLLTRQFGKAPKSRSPGIFTYSQYPRDTR